MTITKLLTLPEAEVCTRIWNRCILRGEILFKPLTPEEFTRFFTEAEDFFKYTAVAKEGETVLGFGSCAAYPGEQRGYITCVFVREESRRQGIGRAILKNQEETLVSSCGVSRIDLVFYNPMMIPWDIPEGKGADHPCAPGVDVESPAMPFYLAAGYREYVRQNSYYLRLTDYHMPDDLSQRKEKLLASGFEVCFYDSARHHGFPEFFDAIANEGWRKAVLSQLDKPIVIAARTDNGQIVGYTGPLSLSAGGGRGNFHGIGVDPAVRGHGLGTVLFASLCIGLKEMGARFMTLYTGQNNSARFIYEGAGFHTVHSWADLRKDL